jgi:uncharacterized RDD family membrane protein YckC
MPYCPTCGGFHAEDAGFCPFCGGPVGDTPRPVNYSGFWRRVGGWVIDSLVIGIPLAIFDALVGGNGLSTTKTIDSQTGNTVTHFHFHAARFFALFALQLIVAGTYSVLMQTSSNQGTLGMMGLGIKVTGEDGQRITRGRALGRYVAYAILTPITVGLGLLVMLVTKRKQGLHDLIAHTLVVRARD